jgi:hypothetical protein
MGTKRLTWIMFTILSLIALVLTGAFGLVLGRAQSSRARPAPVPAVATPTPTEEPIDVPIVGTASISGQVFHDLCAVGGGEGGVPLAPSPGCVQTVDGGSYRANGLLEAGEPGLGGVLVQLGAGTCPASGLGVVTTDTGGNYAFGGLRAGTYCVSVDALSSQNGSLLPGDWTVPSSANGAIAGYTLALEDGEKIEVNFGWDYRLLPQPEPPVAELPTPEPTPEPTCIDKVTFVGDVTIPDNTYMLAGQSFVKTWRLSNAGTCPWTGDYELAFSSGHRMGGPASIPLGKTVAPGEIVDVSVVLTAPAGNGAYEGRWQLRNAEGDLFGTGGSADSAFWVRIAVGPVPTVVPTSVPTVVPTSVPTVVPVVANWRGEYYPNRHLTGDATLVRDDREINFDWGTGSPAAGVPADGFSVRWTRTASFRGGLYRFYAHSDDGVRVWLNGELIIDRWHDAANVTYSAERTLSAGDHTIRVEYYENNGTASVRFYWEMEESYPDWQGEYWSNREMKGRPGLVRNDVAIDFDWGLGAPGGLQNDDVSVRWTRMAEFDAAIYRFHILVDDGARLWVDNRLVVDSWRDGAVRELTADYTMTRGLHGLMVEFYEHTGEARIRVWWEKISPAY